VHVLPLGTLVADVAEERAALLTAIGDEVAQDVLLGHTDAAMGRAQVDEQTVEGFVVERVVDESCNGLVVALKAEAGGREPLPVAVVAEDAGAVAPFVKELFHLFDAPDFEVFQQLLVADAEQFEGLYDIVAEPVVELPFDVGALLSRFLGEGRGQVLTNQLAAVPDDMVDE